MPAGNVLVVGALGVGKSTLIDTLLDPDEPSDQVALIVPEAPGLHVYSTQRIPFRLMEAIGFEQSFSKRSRPAAAREKQLIKGMRQGEEKFQVNAIWFCVDGSHPASMDEAVKSFAQIARPFDSVPIIVVIAQSYSNSERKKNIQTVCEAFAQHRRIAKNLKAVIPVVAKTCVVDSSTFVPPSGIMDLVDMTNAVMPEALKADEKDIAAYKLKRKRVLAQSVIGASAAAGVAVGAVPIPFPDAAILTPMEIAEVNALRKIYEIPDGDAVKKATEQMIEVGTASIAAKAAISALKAVPGINLAGDVLNAIVAGAIVVAIGEGSALVFEKMSRGELSAKDLDAIKQFMEKQLDSKFVKTVVAVAKKYVASGKGSDALRGISEMLLRAFDTSAHRLED